MKSEPHHNIRPLDPQAYARLAVTTLRLTDLDEVLTASAMMLPLLSRLGGALQVLRGNFGPASTRRNGSPSTVSREGEQSEPPEPNAATATPQRLGGPRLQSLPPQWKAAVAPTIASRERVVPIEPANRIQPAAQTRGVTSIERVAKVEYVGRPERAAQDAIAPVVTSTTDYAEPRQGGTPSIEETVVSLSPSVIVKGPFYPTTRVPNEPLPRNETILDAETPTAAPGSLSASLSQRRTQATQAGPFSIAQNQWSPGYASEPLMSSDTPALRTRTQIVSLGPSQSGAPMRPQPWTAHSAADASITEAEQVESPPEAFAPSSQAQSSSEAREGIIILDGNELGRWMIDHLTNHAMRPAAGSTGIDPRMNASFPGAPTGI